MKIGNSVSLLKENGETVTAKVIKVHDKSTLNLETVNPNGTQQYLRIQKTPKTKRARTPYWSEITKKGKVNTTTTNLPQENPLPKNTAI